MEEARSWNKLRKLEAARSWRGQVVVKKAMERRGLGGQEVAERAEVASHADRSWADLFLWAKVMHNQWARSLVRKPDHVQRMEYGQRPRE